MTLEKLLCQEWAKFDGKKKTGFYGYSFHLNRYDLEVYAKELQEGSDKIWRQFVFSFPWAKKVEVERSRPHAEPMLCEVPQEIYDRVCVLGFAFVYSGKVVGGTYVSPEQIIKKED